MENPVATTPGSLSGLCLLAEKYGTDKLGVYTPFYDLLFADRRLRTFRVLEIGVGTPEAMPHVKGYQAGASLRMWREYFPHADVVGLDYNENACAAALADRILTLPCDQRSEGKMMEIRRGLALGGRFDLILDDGSHESHAQLNAFRNLSPLLAPHGLYIVEDVDNVAELSPYLPEHTVVDHIHNFQDREIGRCVLIQGEAIQ